MRSEVIFNGELANFPSLLTHSFVSVLAHLYFITTCCCFLFLNNCLFCFRGGTMFEKNKKSIDCDLSLEKISNTTTLPLNLPEDDCNDFE